jgi:3-oxoacyl-[acyl-carrier protein] reductase
MKRLEGQYAFITGAGKGIGKAVASLFAEEGATVFLLDILNEVDEVADEIRGHNLKAESFVVDVRDRKELQSLVESIISRYGRIDILINNAGIIRDRTFLKMSDDEWHDVMDINLNSVFTITKLILPHMKESGYGRIVSASSINGYVGTFGQTNYSSSKAAIIGFTKSLAKEVGKYGITVNAVAPGFIQTDMTASMPAAVIEAGMAAIPVGRAGQPEDVAHAYLFLASREAGFVNGEILNVNGGVYA